MRNRNRRKSTLAAILLCAAALSGNSCVNVAAEETVTEAELQAAAEEPEYTLEQVVVLSRHNIRSPLSAKGSMIDEITPHEWFAWTSEAGELSLRGAMLETTMGQYFRLWLEKEGLFPANYIPEEGAVRFYANGLQRTQATAHYFSTGLLPVAVVPVERHVEYNEGDATFLPLVNFTNESYELAVHADVAEQGGGIELSGYRASLEDAFRIIMDVTDMEESEAYKNGTYGNLATDLTIWKPFEVGKEPGITGPIRTAVSLADALVLQYYEEPDDKKAAFGHELTEADWKEIGKVLEVNEKILFSSSLIAPNVAHPILEEVRSELNTEGRKFSFLCGHDSTIASFLSALGVEEYTLEGAIEPATPIGSKVVFERWTDEAGEDYFKVNLVYQSVEQLRSIQPLSLEEPPMIVPLSFEGVETAENGMIPEAALMRRFESALKAYDELQEKYTEEGVKQDEAAEAIPDWREDSPAMASIVSFVESVTDEKSPAYLRPEERVAVFDSDGTLIGERYPNYSDQCMMMQRLLHDENYEAVPEDKAFAAELERASLGRQPEPDSPRSTAQMTAESFKGCTVEEYRNYVGAFMAQRVPGFEGMTYGERWFIPMVSLVRYLAEHDFRVYICSGTERLFLREMIIGRLDQWIPPYQVIGTEFSLTASGQGDKAGRDYTLTPEDEVLIEGNMSYKNLKVNKVFSIIDEIGVVPVLAFGNSSGDFAMGQYTVSHGGQAYMLLCDDTERDYGDTEEAEAFAEKCHALGFNTVSMRDEFETIYAEGIVKTAPEAMEEMAEPAAEVQSTEPAAEIQSAEPAAEIQSTEPAAEDFPETETGAEAESLEPAA